MTEKNVGRPSHTTAYLVLLFFLSVAAILSLCFGFREAINGGIDFQWSGARLLGEHIDPWKTFLDGDPDHRIIMGQQPNYLHLLYVLLLPLGKLSFGHARVVWAVANLVFLVSSLLLVRRLYHLNFYGFVLLTALTLMSTPLRVTLSNGQQSLFSLCCFTIAFTLAGKFLRGFALGLGFVKYSLAPVFVVVDCMRFQVLTLLGVATPIVMGLIVARHMTGTPLLQLMVEPLRSARISMSPGYGDIMTASQMWLTRFDLSQERVFAITSIGGFLIAIVMSAFVTNKRFPLNLELALLTIVTLFCFKHLIYDYVFMVFPLAALLELGQTRLIALSKRDRVRNLAVESIGWASVLYLLFFISVVNRLHPGMSLAFILTNGVALFCVASALTFLGINKSVVQQ